MNRIEIKKMLNQMCADEINLLIELIRTDYKDISIAKDPYVNGLIDRRNAIASQLSEKKKALFSSLFSRKSYSLKVSPIC